MANVLVDEQTLKNIADSIRAKSGKTDKMLPSAMSTEIDNLSSGTTEDITSEITTQDALLSELEDVLANKASGSGTTEDLTSEISTQDALLSELEDILANKAAGGSSGGSVETCTGTLDTYRLGTYTFWYIGEDMSMCEEFVSPGNSVTVTVIKGSILVFNASGDCSLTGGSELIIKNNINVIYITDDFSLTYF